MKIDLRGKAVVVTGAGQGLGAAVARELGRLGAAVVVNDLSAQTAEATAADIRAARGEALAHAGDVSDWGQAERLIARCIAWRGRIDGLVNNAGVQSPGLFHDLDETAVRRQIEVNVVGTMSCASHALKAMLAQSGGSIVNTTSGAQCGLPLQAAYAASKGAVASFTYSVASEIEGTGVRVNAVSPMADTPMAKRMHALRRARGQQIDALPPPDANAALHAYLLSDAASHLNGQVLRIQNGEISMMSHPSILEPTVRRESWTVEEVAHALDSGAMAPAQPLGVNRVRLAASGLPPPQ